MSDTNEPSTLLRSFIKEKNLKPGDRLPKQSELCSELSIGIRKLHDGMNILRQEGLIETRKKGGTVVLDPDVNFLYTSVVDHLELKGYSYEDLIKARAVFESGAAKEASRNRTTKDLLHILDFLEQLEARHAEGQMDEKEDLDFHLAILAATHNPVLEVFGTIIAKVFFPKIKQQFKAPEKTRAKSNKEHRLIFEAIQKQDELMASQLIYEHIVAPLKGRQINF